MSMTMTEKRVTYDHPCAPIVKFSSSNSHLNNNEEFDDDDMTDDQPASNIGNEPSFNSTLGEHSFKSVSLEDLVKSFDQTIDACFVDQPADVPDCHDEPLAAQADLVAASKTWSELIENLRSSLRHDLKLPNISQSCQTAMQSIAQQRHPTQTDDEDITSIDDLNADEEEELRDQLDMHAVILSSSHEPFLTAEQVISEIDFMLQDMTPDSGYCDDQSTSDIMDLRSQQVKYLSSSVHHEHFDLKIQTVYSLNDLYEELNGSIKDLSCLLVQELAVRDELEYEKETKNTFISLVLSIQNKRRQYQTEKRPKRRSILSKSNYIEPGTIPLPRTRSVFDELWHELFQKNQYLTTVIPFDRDHPTYLSVEHLQSLNQILQAINEDSQQVPEILTKYILNVLCPC